MTGFRLSIYSLKVFTLNTFTVLVICNFRKLAKEQHWHYIPVCSGCSNWLISPHLCGKRGILEYILSSCNVSLTWGRYRWRHAHVLRELSDIIKTYGRRRKGKKDSKHINFVKEGNPTTVKTSSEQETILESATSWEMQAYLGWRLLFFFTRNPHQYASWHCIMVPRRQKNNHGGTYGPMGREIRGGLPDEWNKV